MGNIRCIFKKNKKKRDFLLLKKNNRLRVVTPYDFHRIFLTVLQVTHIDVA